MAQKEGINTPLVIVTAAVSSITLLVIVLAVQGWFQHEEQVEREWKWQNLQVVSSFDHRDDQKKAIEEYRWVDKNKGVAAIPVEQAMKYLVENNGKTPWQSN